MSVVLPAEFENRMQAQLGADYHLYVAALTEPVPVSIRLNPHKPAGYANSSAQVPWEPLGHYLDERPQFTLDPLLHAGAYYVQEASSMFAGYALRQLVGTGANINILDLCAAPGGKSTHYASIIGNNGLLVCNEVIASRLSVLSENLTKWGNHNVLITNNDPADFSRIAGFFDVVAIDAPCSGEGLFRREPAAISEWNTANTQLCAMRQQRIIADVWAALKPSGYLIYSTCTFNPDEDENNMAWIAQTFDTENISIDINPDWHITLIEKNGLIGYRFIQHLTKGEGFFCCVFRKNGDKVSGQHKSKSKLKLQPQPAQKNIASELSYLIDRTIEMSYYQRGDFVTAIPKSIDDSYKLLINNLKVVKAGICMAKVVGSKIVPEHDLAMSQVLNSKAFETIELPLPEALRYLHRDNVFVPDTMHGFNLLTYNRIPLGFVKNIGTRWNNLYPQSWKIRMNLPF